MRHLLAGFRKTRLMPNYGWSFPYRSSGRIGSGYSTRLSGKAAASEGARRTLRYVEPLSDARTPLAGFSSILVGSFVLCAMLLGAVQVGAHSAKHAEPVKSFHGGQSLAAGPYHLELVAKDGELLLYVNDHSDKPILTEGAKAKATIQQGFENTTTQVELVPAGENQLKGTGTFTLSADTGIIVFVKLPQRDAHAAKFTPLKTKS